MRTASPSACCEVETCWPGGWRLGLRSFPRLRPLEDQRIPMIKHLLARHRVRHPGSCHRCELWSVSEECLVCTFTQQLSSSSSLEESETVVSIHLCQGRGSLKWLLKIQKIDMIVYLKCFECFLITKKLEVPSSLRYILILFPNH